MSLVGVVYVEACLTTSIRTSPDTVVDRAFGQKCIAHFLHNWHDQKYFSGLDSSHFIAVPKPDPKPKQTVAHWKGLMTVAMPPSNQAKGQKASLQGFLVEPEESAGKVKQLNSNLLRRIASEKKEKVSVKAAYENSIPELRERLSKLEQRQDKDRARLERAHKELHKKLDKELQESREFYKKAVDLSNKVKRRVALLEARKRVCEVLGRPKGSESWFNYIKVVTKEEWGTLGLEPKEVKEILGGGAFTPNHSVHEIPPEEIVDSIYPHNLERRDAWIAIFRFAYPEDFQHVEELYFSSEANLTRK